MRDDGDAAMMMKGYGDDEGDGDGIVMLDDNFDDFEGMRWIKMMEVDSDGGDSSMVIDDTCDDGDDSEDDGE